MIRPDLPPPESAPWKRPPQNRLKEFLVCRKLGHQERVDVERREMFCARCGASWKGGR